MLECPITRRSVLTSEAFGSTVGVFGEAEYRRGALGLDLTVSCPEALLAVEAGVQRPHVESMFLAAAPGAFERSVEDIIVPRVRGQLARKARMLASGEIPRPPGGQYKPILPVLVLIDGFPQAPTQAAQPRAGVVVREFVPMAV